MSAVAQGVPVAATTGQLSKGYEASLEGEDDASLQARLAANDKNMRSAAYGDVDGPPVAKLVEERGIQDRKDFNPYQVSERPAWETVKPNGKNKGGGQQCVIA